ncbi:MAG: serine/threonine-protein kinase, partial [Kofleriaceae bacterium]
MLSDVIPVAARRPLDDLVGAQVGDYLIEGVLGRGGMGTVYAAVHRVIGKQVALKVIRAGLVHDPVVIERFEQEARAATRIGHRNIIDIYSYGTLDDGRPYYVMERLRGRSLAVRIVEGALPLDEVAAIIGAICSALAAAHAEGVVHRDLKPDNIFLLEGAGPTEIKLLDFGVAKLQGAGRPSVSLTETGAILGTPRYMAPEQARGHTASAATDVYALGGIAYEMITGAPAFEGTNAADLVAQHLLEPAPRLRDSLRVPRALDDLVAAMLAKEPEDRPTIEEIQEAFHGLANSAGTPRRRRWPLVAGALVAAAAAAAIAWRFASPGVSAARTQPAAPRAQLGAEMSAASGDPSAASGDPRAVSGDPRAASGDPRAASGDLQRAHRDSASA